MTSSGSVVQRCTIPVITQLGVGPILQQKSNNIDMTMQTDENKVCQMNCEGKGQLNSE
jgi:hypothetical protein